MSSTSGKGADAFRLWLKVTSAMHSAEGTRVAAPQKPLGWMVLVYLWTQPDGSASFADLKAQLGVSTSASLSKALSRLEKSKQIETVRGRSDDGREVEVRLTSSGRIAIGKIHQIVFPESK